MGGPSGARVRRIRRWSLVRGRGESVRDLLRRLRRRSAGQRSAGQPSGRTQSRPGRIRILIAAATCLLGLAGWIVFATPVLGVADVDVRGVQTLSPDQIRRVAAVPPGTPLARVNTGAIAARVGALPVVAQAVVSRAWPRTLIIDVRERQPVAVVGVTLGFLVLDSGGVGYATVSRRPADVVLIQVANPGPADDATRAALRVIAALTPQLRAQLRLLVADSPLALRLELGDGRVVIWGDARDSEIKAQVATSLLSRPGSRIDVSEPSVATVS